MRPLSKSKLLAFRQCPKRLWLECHRPEVRQDSASTQATFAVGHQVGDLARSLFDPLKVGQTIDLRDGGWEAGVARTTALLAQAKPIFEAGFAADGAMAFADVMIPVDEDGTIVWRMIEVKSSTRIKPAYREDVAVQAFVARRAGVALQSISLAHIDNGWVYPGNGDYQGLLVETDLTADTFARESKVVNLIAQAHVVAKEATEPAGTTGDHCNVPYGCGFLAYCEAQQPPVAYPIKWLPNLKNALVKALIKDGGLTDMGELPDDFLTELQQRVKHHTMSGEVYFDKGGAAADLVGKGPPAYFIDFETISPAVPIWRGTRPFEKIPYQFSVHHLTEAGSLFHHSHLDLSGDDPSRGFAEALVAACGTHGPVFVYNKGFEKGQIRALSDRFDDLAAPLRAINARVVDLLPIARNRYYHPSQQGSWSIKKVLPAIAPELCYEALEGVQDGGMATHAFTDAIAPSTTVARKAEIEEQLIRYCGLDTYAMVRIWSFFRGTVCPAIALIM